MIEENYNFCSKTEWTKRNNNYVRSGFASLKEKSSYYDSKSFHKIFKQNSQNYYFKKQ